MEEIVALFAICLLTGVGWVAAKLCFAKAINDENCIYFAPALGRGFVASSHTSRFIRISRG